MAHTTLFNEGSHSNILFEDFDAGGLAVQSNQLSTDRPRCCSTRAATRSTAR